MNTDQKQATLEEFLAEKLRVFCEASQAVVPSNYGSWAAFSAKNLLPDLREAVAENPALLEELGLERVVLHRDTPMAGIDEEHLIGAADEGRIFRVNSR